MTRIFSETKKAYGSLDVLVNNAGVFKFGPLESNSEEDIEWQVRTNYFGTLFSIQESLKYFGPKGGSIINISSIVSENPGAMMAVYSSTKGAIDTLTKGMARELGAKNIRVNAVAPGSHRNGWYRRSWCIRRRVWKDHRRRDASRSIRQA